MYFLFPHAQGLWFYTMPGGSYFEKLVLSQDREIHGVLGANIHKDDAE